MWIECSSDVISIVIRDEMWFISIVNWIEYSSDVISIALLVD